MGKNRQRVPQGRGMNALDRVQARMEEKFEIKQRFMTDFLLQAGCDAFLLAAADVFQMGKGRAKAAMGAYREYVMKIMDEMLADSGGDEDLSYFWADLDRRLKKTVGDELFVPHDQRYDDAGIRIFGDLCKRTVAKILTAEGGRNEQDV